MRSILLAAITTVSLVGCVGGLESGSQSPDPLESPDGDGNDNGDNPAGGDLTAAKQIFDDKIFAVIQKCGGGACHAENATSATLTRFVATDAARGWTIATNYQSLVGNFAPSAAPILTFIKPGTHKGVTWTPDEETKITEWLNKEVELRNGQTTTPPPGTESLSAATERVLSEFAGCMTLQNFQASNMKAWGDVDCQNNQECENCHATGGEGFIASQAETQFYNVVSTKKYFFLQYLTVDLTLGAPQAKVVVNETSFRGVYNAKDPHREHPTFNLDNEGMTALRQFYDLTMARKAAGQCDPPRALANN
ncbi:MAG: hypothetical protein SFX73_40965 [Kofleriaceae bacterium]|nr:hypothetical protein [Kofleriaceae bacterium]